MIPQESDLRRVRQDPKDADFYNNPYSFYAKLHAMEGPAFWEEYGLWCLCGFEAVNGALKDPKFARLPPIGMESPSYPPHLNEFTQVEKHSLLALEPPQHTRIRKCVNQAFVNRSVAQMATEIEELANRLVDDFEPSGETDLLKTYATPLPLTVIARLLGVPKSDQHLLLSWSHAMVRVYTMTQTKQEEIEANTAASEFRDFLLDLIKQRRASPKEDLVSQLATIAADPLSDDEIVSTAVLLLNAGHEATVHQIGNTVNALLTQNWPSDWIDNTKQADKIIAEAMRFDPPLHLFTRYAQEDVVLSDNLTIEKGQQIALLLGAANRDPSRFHAADSFQPNRKDAASVAFGAGTHFCVGATLAKLEMRIAINTLFKRLPSMKLAEPAIYQNSFHFHGLEALKVTF